MVVPKPEFENCSASNLVDLLKVCKDQELLTVPDP
jgi:hypothetical protein